MIKGMIEGDGDLSFNAVQQNKSKLAVREQNYVHHRQKASALSDHFIFNSSR